MKRQAVKVTVFEKDGVYGSLLDGGKYEPDSVGDVIDWLTKLLASIPAEHQASARFEVESYSEYDSDKAVVRVTYTRPETDEELAERIAEEKERRQRNEAQERRQLDALKAKYEAKASK